MDGKEVKDYQLYQIASMVGSVFQNPRTQFYNIDTTSKIVFGCENLGLTVQEMLARLENTTKYFKLENLLGRSLFALSGGEKQRVAIGSAVASGKEIIIFDEPISGLDYRHMLEVSEKLIQLKEMKKSLFLITYDLELIYKCCTHFMFIERGRTLWHRSMDNEAVRLLQEFFSHEKDDSAMAI